MSEKKYNPQKIERRWQEAWRVGGRHRAVDFDKRPKAYILVEFPYPSGDGLHVGHCLSYIAQDVIARWKRLEGRNVLYPMGWDAFGLPTENFAIKNKIKPHEATANNISTFKRQIESLGISFDWSREVNTSDPSYYKWTQWIFLQFFKAGLAEKKEVPIHWCPSCKIGLAFEEVIDGKCERCGTPTVRRTIKQWVLKITKYADRLIADLDTVDFLPEIKQQQINWIGRSEGAELEFTVKDSNRKIKVFTTRPDTLFGATYLVLSPEHPLLADLNNTIPNWHDVHRYIAAAASKTDRERQENKAKTGIELKGTAAINPATNEEIPIWVADYVLAGYGTGAIMAVPVHDERDFEFAKKYGLPVVKTDKKFDGGKKTVRYKLRDWIFSRQRYWGEPIPIIICDKCGYVPLNEKDLPLVLPDVPRYEPIDTGESPLAKIASWVEVRCPVCGGAAKRETDTMPNWAGSSWYFLRYTDPHNDREFASAKKLAYWLPVDLYNGGSEHTTLHLLYSRFWHKFLYDLKLVPTPEPYRARVQHGMVLAPDGRKMSKSRGNVINPDEIVSKYGADTFRLYMMFMGEYDQVKLWSDKNLQGVRRFLDRLWRFAHAIEIVETTKEDAEAFMSGIIDRVTSDLTRRSFNTVVSQLMIALNYLEKLNAVPRGILERYMILAAPFIPHFAEEVWQSRLGHTESIHAARWPTADMKYIKAATRVVAIQINGTVRDRISISGDLSEDEVKKIVFEREKVKAHLAGKRVKKFIYVKGKIASIVIQ